MVLFLTIIHQEKIMMMKTHNHLHQIIHLQKSTIQTLEINQPHKIFQLERTRLTPTIALNSSISTINNLNTSSKFSNNQTVLLHQKTFSQRMPQILTPKPADAQKLTDLFLFEELSSKTLFIMPITILL